MLQYDVLNLLKNITELLRGLVADMCEGYHAHLQNTDVFLVCIYEGESEHVGAGVYTQYAHRRRSFHQRRSLKLRRLSVRKTSAIPPMTRVCFHSTSSPTPLIIIPFTTGLNQVAGMALPII